VPDVPNRETTKIVIMTPMREVKGVVEWTFVGGVWSKCGTMSNGSSCGIMAWKEVSAMCIMGHTYIMLENRL
jgi:hypothetical protein